MTIKNGQMIKELIQYFINISQLKSIIAYGSHLSLKKQYSLFLALINIESTYQNSKKIVSQLLMFDQLKQKVSYLFSGQKEQQKKNIIDIPKNFSYDRLKNGNAKIVLHGQYQINPDDPYYQPLSVCVFLANQKKNYSQCKMRKKFHLEYYPSFEFALSKAKMEQEKCTICLCEFQIKPLNQIYEEVQKDNDDDIYMLKCSHMFHFGCLKNLIKDKDWAKCPVCSTIFGIMTGDQPEGKMDVTFDHYTDIPGHGKGAITIHYRMKSGYRNGVAYQGTSRTAYLPDNKEGREVLQLFRLAWNRKLIFTVGRSVTSGLDNQTVWNGIHHKTSVSGGVGAFGYPDPTYLTRVKEQLAIKGITLESIKQKKN